MLINLPLASIAILLSFLFLFRVAFNNFFMIPVLIENAKLKLALAVPKGASKTVTEEAIDNPPYVADN